jgi:two-component system, NarL family, nitrate/nitrite response regulator NarL
MESTPLSRKIRVLVADSSRLHSQLLTNALQQDPDLVVIGWDPNSSSLISTLSAQEVDVLAMSSGFGGQSSNQVESVRDVHSRFPKTKIVVLLDSQDGARVTDFFRAGARGVFGRESSVEMFRKCVRSINRGEIWADNREISLAVSALASAPVLRTIDSAGFNLLSKREFEVVQCVVQGMTNREIAEHLRLSQHTVKNYLFRVFDKLGVSSRVELLFMTLGRYNDVASRIHEPFSNDVLQQIFSCGSHDRSTVAFLEKAAEEGAIAAQFSLAQAFAARGGADELADAYTWLLIAGEQALQERMQLAKRLTPGQIDAAERKVALRCNRVRQKIPATLATSVPPNETHGHDREEAETIGMPEAPTAAVAATESSQKSVARPRVPADHILSYGSA